LNRGPLVRGKAEKHNKHAIKLFFFDLTAQISQNTTEALGNLCNFSKINS